MFDSELVLRVDKDVAKGTIPDYGTPPGKASSETHDYTFAGWSPEIAPVTQDVVYTAVYTPVPHKYAITWLDDDNSQLRVDMVSYGETPDFGSTPTKAGSVQYSYAFAGWSPALTSVTGPATYKATYDSTVNKYTVTWKNENGTTLKTDTDVAYGTTPNYTGSTPTKAEDAAGTYTFKGWNPTPSAITGNTTYTATYTTTAKTYTVTWKNHDGSTLKTDANVAYGTTPSYTGATPTKAEDANYTYTFKGWNPIPAAITGNTTYTATFTAKAKTTGFPSTLYFTNSLNWDKVYVYAWNSSGSNAAWPGVKMTFHRLNPQSQEVWSATGLNQYTSIIFNCGSNASQTVDIASTTMGNDNAYYAKTTQTGGKYNVGTWTEHEGSSINTSNSSLRILHCFDWSLATIKANLHKIAAAGFNAIQTSPLQPAKDYNPNKSDKNEFWWRYYQPVGLCVGNNTNSVFFSTNDGHAELQELTAAAAEQGIRIIVDVVVNHLGDGSGNGGLHPSVGTYENWIYNNTGSSLHNWSGSDALGKIVLGNITGKDLNTGNTKVQERVRDFLKSLIDDGVTGFRFDAAKHIETPNESNYASSFWTNTLGQAKTYAANKKQPLFAYGEVINGTEGGRNYGQYIYSAGLNAVTDSVIGEKYRYGAMSEYGIYTGVPAENNVIYPENHDEFFNAGTSSWTVMNMNDYYSYMSIDQPAANLLYFVRVDTNANIGTLPANPGNSWQNNTVRMANITHGS